MSRRRASPAPAPGASCSCTSRPTSCRSASSTPPIAIGWAIITEASVSFLGFGDSTSVSWGFMLQDAFSSQALSRGQYAWFVPPGICIILVVVAGFFISRGYEEVFMPRLRAMTLCRSSRSTDLQDPLQHARRRGARRSTARSFAVPEGRIVGLVGESGCGKTTAVRAIMGVLARERPARRRTRRLQGPGDRRGHGHAGSCCGATSPTCRKAP